MAKTIDTDAGQQFVDASNDDGDMVLINEMYPDGSTGRCGWTVLD